jgi:hypothetical protein
MGGLLYSAPQFGAGGGGAAPGGDSSTPGQLGQLALAVKSAKMQEAQTNRQNAQESVKMIMGSPILTMMTDPKQLEKLLFDGYGLKFNSAPPANPAQAAAGAGPAGASDPGPNIGAPDSNTMKMLAAGMQGNKSGAQAGSPASPNAAGKAPGGGVSPTIGPGVVDQLHGQAKAALDHTYDRLAPIYAGAMDQAQLDSVKRNYELMLEEKKTQALGGDYYAMGQIAAASGQHVTADDMRSQLSVATNLTPEITNKALSFALGNESSADQAKRYGDMVTTLIGNKTFMDRVKDPADVTEYARELVYTGKAPHIEMKPHSLDELTRMSEREKFLVNDVGLPYDTAHTYAQSEIDGLSPTLSMPTGFQTIAQRTMTGKEQATAAQVEANRIEAVKAEQAGVKILGDLKKQENQELTDRLTGMIEADKNKHPYPPDIRQGILNQVAAKTGLTPVAVTHWYNYIGLGGSDYEYKKVSDSAAAQAGAGTSTAPKSAEEGGASLPYQMLYRLMHKEPMPMQDVAPTTPSEEESQ